MEGVGKAPRKLNIAMVCDAIDYTAGSMVSAVRFSERLNARGHKLVVVCSKVPYTSGDVEGMKTYRFRSVLVPKAEGKFYLAFPTVAEAKKILRDENIDIVHVIIPFFAAYSFMSAARSMGIPVVTHSHTQAENVFLHVPRILGRDILSAIFTKYLFWMYNKSNALVYPTEFAREESPKMSEDMRYEIISNGVDNSLFRPVNHDQLFKDHDLSPDYKYILFVGRLHPEKSVGTLIRAVPEILKKQPTVRVLVVGEGNQEPELRALTKQLGLEDKVLFKGRFTSEHLVMVYNACAMFCLPSLAELEGMVVLEAMSCGAPILIANSKESASKYFVKNNGMLFEPENPHDLAEKAIEMLSDEKALRAMSRESLKDSKNYDINRSVVRLEDLYYELLSKR